MDETFSIKIISFISCPFLISMINFSRALKRLAQKFGKLKCQTLPVDTWLADPAINFKQTRTLDAMFQKLVYFEIILINFVLLARFIVATSWAYKQTKKQLEPRTLTMVEILYNRYECYIAPCMSHNLEQGRSNLNSCCTVRTHTYAAQK